MNPIFEQGEGQGIGHSFRSLIYRFIEICEEHMANGRAKAFAFILYDFHDEAVKKVLKNKGGFARLDRLSGTNLSVFYLDSNDQYLIKEFNDLFVHAFEVNKKYQLPYVIFFKLSNKEVSDVEIIELEQSNLLFAFEELYAILDNYIAKSKSQSIEKILPITNKITQLVKTAKKVAVEEFIRLVIGIGLKKLENQ